MSITVHTLVKNEERFLWYSVMSVINYVDKILLWDTGSTDKTIQIVKEIKEKFPDKVSVKFLSEVDISAFTSVRQEMLDATKTDWFMVVDADEIWWEGSIKLVTEYINGSRDIESIVVPTINLVGDIYHYQEARAGHYHLAGRVGHLNLRAINKKIPGLHSDKPHGTWGWVDEIGRMIQDREKNKIKYLEAPYLHATFLQRAGDRNQDIKVPKRAKKLKHEIGISFPYDYYYPEVLFRDRPAIVPSVWRKMDLNFFIRSLVETPFRKIKRRSLPAKVGY